MAKVTLSEFIISVIELIDAQFESMKYSLLNSAKGLIFVLVASLLLFVALLFALLGLKAWLDIHFSITASYFIASCITILLSLGLFWIASWTIKKK